MGSELPLKTLVPRYFETLMLGGIAEMDWSPWLDWLGAAGTVVLALSLVALCVVCWLTNLIALPGNWLCVLLLALFAWLGPQEGRVAMDYVPVLIAFVLAFIGEVLEFFAAAAGAQRAGAGKKSTLYSIVGSMIGAIAGAMIGIPVPVVGSVIAAIVFGGLGAALGAMFGEWNDGRAWKENWVVGHSTFWGRTFGTLGKFTVGVGILVVAVVAVLI